MKKNLLILTAFIFIGRLGAESLFEQGEDLLLNNQLTEAAMMFEASLEEDDSNADAYLYLGYIYEVKQDYESAIGVLSRGAEKASGKKEQIYFNLGNNYFKAEDFDTAAMIYSKAMQSRSGYAEPYLNRANCRVRTSEYSLAIRDYNLFLNMKPDDPQRPQIEKMISMLELTLVEEENRRKDEEQRRLAEEARQKALLDSVLNSLSNAGSDTTNLSAESENIEDIEIELDIED
ncbi:MAG: tetratricopeptide repeat protein [Spirochaetales bacterium]|uniref:Tetratricopeptide repeat protein n=1 Tax=Candidatus Thalassospirochaeta sargassi TaxID=3119039 RepID=A0AAJ1IDP3_9SPIO|nr:tetratricopeptide repeat protein [Spirochaetales bacterium]